VLQNNVGSKRSHQFGLLTWWTKLKFPVLDLEEILLGEPPSQMPNTPS